MPPRASKGNNESKASGSVTEANKKKPRSSASGGGLKKKKLTAFNKFIKEELSRLKESKPDMTHQERFKLATSNWRSAPENPRREKD